MTLETLIRAALDEDVGAGDATTLVTVPLDLTGVAVIRAKEPLVLCGLEAAGAALNAAAARLGVSVTFHPTAADGERLEAGALVARVTGPVAALLTGERLALNLLQHLSGIATHVAAFMDEVGPGGPRVVDTRKTTPLYRTLEKHAVRCGGAFNHRQGLWDGILVKDNHVDAVGGVAEAVRRAKAGVHHLHRIQVEVRSVAEAEAAVSAGADAVLVDNFEDGALIALVSHLRSLRPNLVIEASGGMTAERVRNLKASGLDLISVGGLVHQARWVDLSMKVQPD